MDEKTTEPRESYSRRDILRIGSVLGIGASMAGAGLSACATEPENSPVPANVKGIDPVRVAMVGVGNQGSGHFRSLLAIEGVELRAVCDTVEEKVAKMQALAEEAGKPKPKGYSRGEYDFQRMCAEEELDLVVTATPWKWHVPICVEAMKTGSHAATEVPAAVTIEECWELVETAEKYNKHCVMLENVCYMRPEMMILNMVRRGLFGELLHAEGAYNHDLRELKLGGAYEKDWRVYHSMTRNGNLYPTHGLGPIAQCMNINRGDRFDYLVSMSSPSRGLQEYAQKTLGPDHEFSKAEYKLGDVNTSLIKTVNGKTIYLVHDTNLPRPYSRINLIQGTKGITQGFGDMNHENLIHIEGRTPAHKWEPLMTHADEFEHPFIKAYQEKSVGGGHGGADFLELYRLVHCIRNGLPTDMDVYDGADWSVVSGLTEESVANRSRPVDFPDFTRGLWETRKPLGIIGEEQA
jgi:predicted dehydrogenase